MVNVEHVCRGAVVNVLKHSGATRVTLRADYDAASVRIDIDDNGCGYCQANRVGEGFGISNMNRRMTDAGGSVRNLAAPGGGTRVRIVVPTEPGSRRDGAPEPRIARSR